MKIFIAAGTVAGRTLDWLAALGVKKVLVSYINIKDRDIKVLPFDEVILDSGAFSAMMSDAVVPIEAYCLWLELYLKKHTNIVSYINLDVMNSWEGSMKNQEYMEKRGLRPMPVYHYGEPEEVLRTYTERYEWIGISGFALKGMPNDKKTVYWDHIATQYPKNKFHLLGCTSMDVVFNHQPYSMDSASWTAGSRYGDIACYKDGVPGWYDIIKTRTTGFKVFFTAEEADAANIRCILDWEKLEWLDAIKKKNGDIVEGQHRLM